MVLVVVFKRPTGADAGSVAARQARDATAGCTGKTTDNRTGKGAAAGCIGNDCAGCSAAKRAGARRLDTASNGKGREGSKKKEGIAHNDKPFERLGTNPDSTAFSARQKEIPRVFSV
jgi:hypothetical protein